MGNSECHGRAEQGDPNNSRVHRRKVSQREGYLSYDLRGVPAERTM